MTISLVRRGFLRFFNVSTFLFLLILCRGLGHLFGSGVASPVPLWVPLVHLLDIFLPLLWTPGCPKSVGKVRCFSLGKPLQNMRRRVRIVYRAPPQISQKQGRHREVSKKPKNTTESAPKQRPGDPQGGQGHPKEPRRKLCESKRPPKRSKVAPWRCPSPLKPTVWTFHSVQTRPTQSSTASPRGHPKSAK